LSSNAALAEDRLAAVGASALAVVDWITTEFASNFGQCEFSVNNIFDRHVLNSFLNLQTISCSRMTDITHVPQAAFKSV
jgi:hypothetical protein